MHLRRRNSVYCSSVAVRASRPLSAMSASLRTRRPSTVYNESDDQQQQQDYAIPAVPSLTGGHAASGSRSGDQRMMPPSSSSGDGRRPSASAGNSRPQARHAKSSESDTRAGGGRNRAGTSASREGGGEPSKVGAILLNKRQSVSFGKAMAAQTRAGVRGDEGYASSGAARYNDGMGKAGAPPVPTLAHGGGRRGGTQEGTGMSAGEEMIATGPRGPTGSSLNELLKEDFIAENCMSSRR